jgi:FMN phosphatase YigB (HAD superfamily)
MIEVVAFACRGTLLDWTRAVDAVAYELARRNGESPLDRGAALGRRAETLAVGHGLRHGFERLVRERRYRVWTDADKLLTNVVALAPPLPGACDAVALAAASGRRVFAVSRGERPEALDRFGGAFDEVVTDPSEIDADPEAILYVSSARHRRAEARDAGMHAVAPRALAQALTIYSVPATLSVP